jgi:hypothetical protein
MTWAEIEQRLKSLDRRAIALVVARSAQRLLPLVLLGEADYGPEVTEWHAAVVEVLKSVESYGADQRVSRYQLNLASDIARGTANTLANRARQFGASAHLHDIELALAAVAFAADAARADSADRVVVAALQVLKMQAQKWPIEECDFALPATLPPTASGSLSWQFVTSSP